MSWRLYTIFMILLSLHINLNALILIWHLGRDIDSLEYFKEHVGGKMGDPSSLRYPKFK